MSWNSSLPTDGTKLRLAPSQIRANWQALENGAAPLNSVRLIKQAVNPTREGSRGFLFGKDPGSGFTELYYLDDRNPAAVTPMTTNGKLGSTSTQIVTSGVSYDATYYYTASNYVAARAIITTNGNANESDGITATKTSTGVYRVTVAAGRLQTSSYQVIVTPWFDGSNIALAMIDTAPNVVPANPTNIIINTYRWSNGAAYDNKFNVIVVGGR